MPIFPFLFLPATTIYGCLVTSSRSLIFRFIASPYSAKYLGKRFSSDTATDSGPMTWAIKGMKKVFTHPFSQGLFSWLHPDMGTGLAHFFFQKKAALRPHRPNVSGWATKRNGCCNTPNANWSAASNRTILFSVTATCPSTGYYPTAAAATSISANGWWANSYAVFDGQKLEICFFENPNGQIVSNYR